MPNWVSNRIEFKGDEEKVKQILDQIAGENSPIDFEKIIPMPENIYRGDLGQKERELYSENNWYDWSISNWGTKWNACYAERVDNVIAFDTAWSLPMPIYDALFEMCKEKGVSFEGSWSNEDLFSGDSGTFFGDQNGLSFYDDETEEEREKRYEELMGFDPTEEE